MIYIRQWVRCGNKRCHSCPHGPYWYAYWYAKGKMHSRYIGKDAPELPGQMHFPDDDLDAITSKKTATPELAMRILGLTAMPTLDLLNARYRQLAVLHHPDKGGDAHLFARISAAWSFLSATARLHPEKHPS